MNKRTFKNKIYQELATVIKAMSNPHRLEILELLAQRSFSVEDIATQTELSVANASQHLQVLKRAQLVETQKRGTYVYYQLANQNVFRAWKALRDLGMDRIAEIERLVRTFRASKQALESVSSAELIQRLKQGEVTIIDVRPKKEYDAGHISGALSLPIDQLVDRLKELPQDGEIVAYCRGPFCVFSDEAVELLTRNGYAAKRLEEGFPEWILEGFPVETSTN